MDVLLQSESSGQENSLKAIKDRRKCASLFVRLINRSIDLVGEICRRQMQTSSVTGGNQIDMLNPSSQYRGNFGQTMPSHLVHIT